MSTSRSEANDLGGYAFLVTRQRHGFTKTYRIALRRREAVTSEAIMFAIWWRIVGVPETDKGSSGRRGTR